MPTYVAQCCECATKIEYMSKILYRDAINGTKCPFCETGTFDRIMTTVAFGDAVRMGFTRPDQGMREVLQKIQEKSACAHVTEQSNLTRL